MISRAFRFRGHGSLRKVYQKSRSARTAQLSVRYARSERRSTYRAAVVVSKKVSKSAVVRNRIRRRIYEQVRLLAVDFTEPYDIVITVFDEALATAPAEDIARSVKQLMAEAKIL